MSESDTPTRPLIFAAIGPESGISQGSFEKALHEIAHQDQSIRFTIDPASQQASVRVMDQSHLERLRDRLQRDYSIKAVIGEPRVIYLHSIRHPAESEGKYIRQTGGFGNYGHVELMLEPADPAHGIEFIDAIRDGIIPKQFIQAAEQGIRKAAADSLIAGCELAGIRVILFGGSFHDLDSNETAFNIAAASAFTNAVGKANPVLLEPIMAVEVAVPDDRARFIMADLVSRRVRVIGSEHRSGTIIHAVAPLAAMLGYAQRTHAPSAPLVECTMRFLHYAEIPSGDDREDGDAGIPAIKPSGPKPLHGAATADPDTT
jgi:elongation factor G